MSVDRFVWFEKVGVSGKPGTKHLRFILEDYLGDDQCDEEDH